MKYDITFKGLGLKILEDCHSLYCAYSEKFCRFLCGDPLLGGVSGVMGIAGGCIGMGGPMLVLLPVPTYRDPGKPEF